MSRMIEICARVLCIEDGYSPDSTIDRGDDGGGTCILWHNYRDTATTVLHALSENVTEDMLKAGRTITLEWLTKRDWITVSDAGHLFTAMLAAELQPDAD